MAGFFRGLPGPSAFTSALIGAFMSKSEHAACSRHRSRNNLESPGKAGGRGRCSRWGRGGGRGHGDIPWATALVMFVTFSGPERRRLLLAGRGRRVRLRQILEIPRPADLGG